jgi:hypothetical protein
VKQNQNRFIVKARLAGLEACYVGEDGFGDLSAAAADVFVFGVRRASE